MTDCQLDSEMLSDHLKLTVNLSHGGPSVGVGLLTTVPMTTNNTESLVNSHGGPSVGVGLLTSSDDY